MDPVLQEIDERIAAIRSLSLNERICAVLRTRREAVLDHLYCRISDTIARATHGIRVGPMPLGNLLPIIIHFALTGRWLSAQAVISKMTSLIALVLCGFALSAKADLMFLATDDLRFRFSEQPLSLFMAKTSDIRLYDLNAVDTDELERASLLVVHLIDRVDLHELGRGLISETFSFRGAAPQAQSKFLGESMLPKQYRRLKPQEEIRQRMIQQQKQG